ncbi:MAG: DUF2007 domain-containing protein [Planctomycetota bacterium]
MENPPEHLESLMTFSSDAEAAVVVAALESAGIKAEATGGFISGKKAMAPGRVRVLVAEHDLPLAKNTLAKLREESSQIDWSAVDVGEPDEDDA